MESDDSVGTPDTEREALRQLRRAEEGSLQPRLRTGSRGFDLADAGAAVEAAEDMLSSLDAKRMEARQDKVTAHRHLAERMDAATRRG